MEKKIYGYARVSTKEQHEDRQIDALIHAGVALENIFIDKQSGKNFDRYEFRELMKLLDKDSVLFISSIDRLGRNYTELNNQWRIITKEKRADVVVLDMPLLDTRKEKNLLGTFISDLVLSLLSYVAETEYHNIKIRQAEGIRAAKAKGVKFGRPRIVLPADFATVTEEWKQKKISMYEAARILNMKPQTYYAKARKYDKIY